LLASKGYRIALAYFSVVPPDPRPVDLNMRNLLATLG
jgi:hypothetical protein